MKVLSIASISLLALLSPSYAQLIADSELPQEREIHDTFSRDQNKGSVIDATNPIELINRLRRASAMDNATSPADAIDDALKGFNFDETDDFSSDLGQPLERSAL